MKKIAISVHATENFSINILSGLKNFDYIHVDVMDGKFVKNKNLNLDTFRILKKNFKTPIIAHLMVVNPFDYIEKIIHYLDTFMFHFEIDNKYDKIINEIKRYDKNVGLAINPDTEIHRIVGYLKDLNIVLIMGVNPGWAGQKFLPNTVNKVNELVKYKNTYDFYIDVDGGVNLDNAKQLINADILTSSSTILKAKNPNKIIQLFKESDKNGH